MSNPFPPPNPFSTPTTAVPGPPPKVGVEAEQPAVETPGTSPAAPRNFTGWVLLFALFAFLIPNVIMSSYANSDPHSTKPEVQEDNLEHAVNAAKTPKRVKRSEQAYRDTVAALAPSHLTDEQSDLVYVVAASYAHQPLSAKDLAVLKKSSLPRHRQFAQIYGDPKPSSAELRKLADAMPEGRFVYAQAKAKALSLAGIQPAAGVASTASSTRTGTKTPNPAQGVVGLLVLAGLMAGCVLIVVYFLNYGSGPFVWLGHPQEPGSLRDADRLALRAAQLFSLYVVGSVAAVEIPVRTWHLTGVAAKIGASGLQELFAAGILIAGVLLLSLVPVMGKRLALKDFGVTGKYVLLRIGWALAGLLAAFPLVTLAALAGSALFSSFAPRPDHPLTKMLENGDGWVIVTALVLASVQAPLFEELLFRGCLQPALSGALRKSPYRLQLSIGIAALLFAALHPQGFALWGALAMIGVVNSVLTYQTRSLLPGMILHALFNGLIVGFTVISPSLSSSIR